MATLKEIETAFAHFKSDIPVPVIYEPTVHYHPSSWEPGPQPTKCVWCAYNEPK